MAHYVNVDFELFEFNDVLSFIDILVYSHISNYYNAKPRILFTKSKNRLAHDFNVSERTIKRSIANLKRYGLIRQGKQVDGSVILAPNPIKKTDLYKERFKPKDNEVTRFIEDFKNKLNNLKGQNQG